MATTSRPATPAFNPVNAMVRNLASRRQTNITPPPQPQHQHHLLQPQPPSTAVGSYGFRSQHTSLTTPLTMNHENLSRHSAGSPTSQTGSTCDLMDSHRSDDGSIDSSEKSINTGKAATKVKKKKGTKFHCKGFGPCNLSFTRSEHLARHIRKHTGERPFMCHCGRWFSRLDNLRQHSSTVHADELIPNDSLAASGTRYHRQGRPDRAPRSRGHSLSEAQPLPIAAAPAPLRVQTVNRDDQVDAPTMSSPVVDRPSRKRPEPIIVPQNVDQVSSFSQYRNQTPPDSPVSTISTQFSRSSTSYRQRASPYPATSQTVSPVTPTSSRLAGGGGILDSPFSSPRNSSLFEPSSSSMASRRLSMPMPATPSLLNPHEPRVVLPVPSSGYGSPAGSTTSRRDSMISGIADDRRKTWHMDTLVNYQYPLSRDILSPTTRSFASTSINSSTPTNPPGYSPITPSRSQQIDRLPSIHHVLQQFSPQTPEQPRSPWADDGFERVSPMDATRFPPGRRIAPGQTRSSHGRSISNIETKRWGGPSPLATSWADSDMRDCSLHPTIPGPMPGGSNRNSGYFGAVNTVGVREHRQSFGSSGDSSVSEGISTPIVNTAEISQPKILGEPGDAVYNHENLEKDYMDQSCEMSGVEITDTTTSVCNGRTESDRPEKPRTGLMNYSVSRLDALVSAAAIAAKI
jgi:hypothetical protein